LALWGVLFCLENVQDTSTFIGKNKEMGLSGKMVLPVSSSCVIVQLMPKEGVEG
jgi:hypothetical protein